VVRIYPRHGFGLKSRPSSGDAGGAPFAAGGALLAAAAAGV
jgi:hypothetical protein